jgi:hypothetical protein
MKQLWEQFEAAQLKMKSAFSNQIDLNKSTVSMNAGKVTVMDHWIAVTGKLALALHNYNTSAALKQSFALCCKLMSIVHPNSLGIFEINLLNFMVFGLVQEAYDWMNNFVPDHYRHFPDFIRKTEHFRLCSNNVWTLNHDISESLMENNLLSIAPSFKNPDDGLFFIKFHYYHCCQLKEHFQQSFLLGTHRRLGAKSAVQYLGGSELVLGEIFSYLIPQGTFKDRSNKKSRDILKQIHQLLRIQEARNLWRALTDGSMIYTECRMVLKLKCAYIRSLPATVKNWKNFSEGTELIKDFFLAEVGESFYHV